MSEALLRAFGASHGGDGLWSAAWRRLRSNRAAVLAATLLAGVVVAAVLGPWVSPHDMESVDWSLSPLASPPSLANGHWFGTDANGRDLFVRVWAGTRVSLLVALLASVVSLVIGVAWGATAGYLGGRVDEWMMRFVDILYALPYMFFVIVLTVVFGRSLWLIFVAIGAVGWLTMARIVRGQALALRSRGFVDAAIALGLPDTPHHRAPHRAQLARHRRRLRHAHRAAAHPLRELPELSRAGRAGAADQPRSAGRGGRARDGACTLAAPVPCAVLASILLTLNFLGEGSAMRSIRE